MTRTPHLHVLDTGEGDWGAYPDEAEAQRAIAQILNDFNQSADIPMTRQDLTIIPAPEWCHEDPNPCDYDERQTFLSAVRTPPLWTHDYPPQSSNVYRIAGKPTARWKLACSMTIDQAMALWPFTGHPEALPQWRYDVIIADTDLCPCSNRSHRKKACIIGPDGRSCQICSALYKDYGSGFNRCLPCTDWLDRRERYLADWAAQNANRPGVTGQLALI